MRLVSQKKEWFIFAGFAMITIAAFAECFIPNIASNLTTLSDWNKNLELRHSWQYVLVGLIDWAGRVVLAASLVIIGLKQLRLNSQKIKSVLFIVAGLGICAFNLITTYFIMTFDYSIPHPNPEVLKKNIENHNYDAKLKSKLFSMYASGKYKYEGKTVEIVSETGNKLLYQPTKEDLKFRDQDVLVKEIWSDNQRRSRPNFYCWIIITIFSSVLGLFIPNRKPNT